MGLTEGGHVSHLYLNVGHREPLQPMESVSFVGGKGIEGDRHFSSQGNRQILLMDMETLDQLGLTPGIVRENVTTAGLDLAALVGGKKIRIGKQVVLEISEPCAPCSRMDEIRPGLRLQLEGRRGMLAVVVEGGIADVGDSIVVL